MARPARDSGRDTDGQLAERVLSSSSGMVGACATLIGLVKLVEPRHGLTRTDEYAALTAVAFVVSAVLAYLAIRTRRYPRLRAQLEFAADGIFLLAMLALAVIGVMFAFDLI